MSSRKNVLLAGSLAALLIVGICASLFVSAANHMTFPSASSQAASDPDDLDAWNAFAFLVHATDEYKDQKPAPAWVDWANKCQAGISSDCVLESTAKTQILGSDLRAMEYPTQVLARLTSLLGSGGRSRTLSNVFVSEFKKAPQMASVLFNPHATAGLRKLDLSSADSLKARIDELDKMNPPATGIARKLPDGTFDPGSVAIKLIWEVVTDAGASDLAQSVYLYNPQKQSIAPGQLKLNPVNKWNSVNLDTSHPERPCPDKLDTSAPQIPISCFFYYHIGDPSDPKTQQELKELNGDVRNVVVGSKAPNSYVILVGVHMMRLIGGHPDWVWSTYYWTAENNRQPKWRVPWNHFQMMTTTAMRDDSKALDAPHNVCFSPYLEGTETNGVTANCLSCHVFAAYNPGSSMQTAGVAYGERYKFLPQDIQSAEQSQFMGSVQTAFMWSIADSQNLGDVSEARSELDRAFLRTHSPQEKATPH